MPFKSLLSFGIKRSLINYINNTKVPSKKPGFWKMGRASEKHGTAFGKTWDE
jgi:hypothetical protein